MTRRSFLAGVLPGLMLLQMPWKWPLRKRPMPEPKNPQIVAFDSDSVTIYFN